MQYWESILKNDAILGIDTKKRCNIGIDVKNDAILGGVTFFSHRSCTPLFLYTKRRVWDPDPGQFPGR
jgi:CTP:phosphocholine cytidylyltransferase-like protein